MLASGRPCPHAAPEEYRESMLKNVRLHREIMEAWAEHGEKAGSEDTSS